MPSAKASSVSRAIIFAAVSGENASVAISGGASRKPSRSFAESDRKNLAPGHRGAVDELAERVKGAAPGERGELEMIARETLEALALGV